MTARIEAYAEIAALHAVLVEDFDGARRIAGEMFPSERAILADQLDTLRAMLTDRFGNDIASEGCQRVRVLDDEGRFLCRTTDGPRSGAS